MLGYKINKELGLLVLKYVGDVSLWQIGELLRQVSEDPDFLPTHNILTDTRGLTTNYSYEELQALAGQIKDSAKNMGQNKNAYLVDKDVTFGICRIWQSIREPETSLAENKIFRNHDEALEWLGLPPDTQIEFPF